MNTNFLGEYEKAMAATPGLGRTVAIRLANELSSEAIAAGLEYSFKVEDITMRNVFVTARSFKRLGITV